MLGVIIEQSVQENLAQLNERELLERILNDVTDLKRDVAEIKTGVEKINERLTPIELHLFGNG